MKLLAYSRTITAATFLSAIVAGCATPPTAEQLLIQRLAIPSYFYPCTGTSGCYWNQLNNGAPTVGLAIINPDTGPGTSQDQNYVNQTLRTQAKGIIVLGYVYTSYGNRPAEEVKSDVDLYYTWYRVNGIFFDEASTDCNVQGYYQELHDYVKTKSETENKVVLNPGINTAECYITAGDIIINFEDSYAHYVDWKPSGWECNYPAERFWHLVINTSQTEMLSAIEFSKSRHAGWVYVTPDSLPNPWDTLPADDYWTEELNAGGQEN